MADDDALNLHAELLQKAATLENRIHIFYAHYEKDESSLVLTYRVAKRIKFDIETHVGHLRRLRDTYRKIDELTAGSSNFDIFHKVRKMRMKSHREELNTWKDSMPIRMIQFQMFKHSLLLQASHYAVLPADDPSKIEFDKEILMCEHTENTLLNEDLKDLRTLFRFYNMDETECNVICEWHSVCSLFGLKDITMESFEECVEDLNLAEGIAAGLRAKIQACIVGFEECEYSAINFCERHSGIKMGWRSASFDGSHYLDHLTF